MNPVPDAAPRCITRRIALARSAIGAAAAAFAGTTTLWPRAALALAADDASLAGPLGDVWIGSPQAKMALVEYAAVTCSHCAAFHNNTWPVIKERWVDTGQVRFTLRGFALNPLDTAGFMLARADGGQRYYAITDMLFEKQAAWAFVPKPVDALRDLLRQAGFSQEKFDATLRDQALYDGVNRVRAQADTNLGVHSTPTLFVDGRKHEGALPSDALNDIIQKTLDGRAD